MAKARKTTRSSTKPPGGLETSLVRSGERTFSGYVFDRADPGRTFVVELFADGHPVAVARADRPVRELAAKGMGDGCYGFAISVHPKHLGQVRLVEARIANTNALVGLMPLDDASPPAPDETGEVKWLGGLRFLAWVRDPNIDGLDVQVDGVLTLRARPNGWMQVGAGEEARAVRAFDIHLPERFADGKAHRVRIDNASGSPLPGCPCAFTAFEDGLERAIAALGHYDSEKLRARQFERLLPQSLPFTRYEDWRRRFPLPAPTPVSHSAAIVTVGPGDADVTIASLESCADAPWVAAALPKGKSDVAFDPKQARDFIREQSDCRFVVFCLAGTVFTADALARLANAFTAHPEAAIAYGDLDIAGADGTLWPLALPAFDYERLLEQGYCAHVFAIRTPHALAALDKGASNLYRLFTCALDEAEQPESLVLHVPGALATLPRFDRRQASAALASASREHLSRRGVTADVQAGAGFVFSAARVLRRAENGTTSIIIPTRNRHALLRKCLESIRPAVAKARAEVIVVDNDSAEPETLAYLDEIDGGLARVLRIAGPFNFARLNNIAVERAGGERVLLLNNDIEALDDTWLGEMMSRLADPRVGAVGALLQCPSGMVQHGGVVLGANFQACHAFNDRLFGDPGYGDLLRVAHQCSAVTAACLLTRRRDYLAAGGMDEAAFPVNFNDVDFCLKLRARGLRVVMTPHARLLHLESASRGRDERPDAETRLGRELRVLRARWGDVLVDDPFYSPLLSLDAIPYSALAWPPRSRGVRIVNPVQPREIPPGF